MHRGLKSALLSLLPSLRAYAFCLTSDRSHADELVHSSLIEIWTRHRGVKGLALKMAAFRVVRCQFLREGMADLISSSFGRQRRPRDDDAFETRFTRLPRAAREALSLIEVWGFNAAQAAEICGCDQQTIARRLAMARRDLNGKHRSSFVLVGINGRGSGVSCAA